jgi:hypothetical protein
MKGVVAMGASCALLALSLRAAVVNAAWLSTNGPVNAKAFDATPSGLFAATSSGLSFTSNYTVWTAMNSGLTNTNSSSITRSAHLANHLALATLGGGVFSSWNNGATWWASNSGLTNMTVRVLASVADSYMGTVYFAGTDSGVFRSNSTPTNWWSVNTGLSQTQIRAFTFFFEGSDENDGIGAHDLLAGTNGGGVFRSGDGASWTAKNAGLTNSFVTALTSSSSYAVTFAGTAGGGVFRSTTIWGGWSPINGGLSNQNVTALASHGTKIFAGTAGGGVFVASNDGNSGWSAANTGLTNLTIAALATDGSQLFAATASGVFRRPLAEL